MMNIDLDVFETGLKYLGFVSLLDALTETVSFGGLTNQQSFYAGAASLGFSVAVRAVNNYYTVWQSRAAEKQHIQRHQDLQNNIKL